MTNSKKRKKITKASKHRLMTIGLVCIGIFIYFCFTVITYTHKIISLTNEEKKLAEKLDLLKTEREYLVIEIEKLQDPDYIAKYARETYFYSKDGEYVLKLEKNKELDNIDSEIQDVEDTKENIEQLSNKYKYVIIISSGVLAMLLTIHIIKNRKV